MRPDWSTLRLGKCVLYVSILLDHHYDKWLRFITDAKNAPNAQTIYYVFDGLTVDAMHDRDRQGEEDPPVISEMTH
jgi:hypothetical protein